MTPEQIAHATWHETSQTTIILKCRVQDGAAVLAAIEEVILKCRVQDGAAVLAAIEEVQCLKWYWSAGAHVGFANTRYAAMRRARKALRG